MKKKKEIERNKNIYSRKKEKGWKERMKMEKEWSYKKNMPKWNETEKKNKLGKKKKKEENMDWIKNRVKCLVDELRKICGFVWIVIIFGYF